MRSWLIPRAQQMLRFSSRQICDADGGSTRAVVSWYVVDLVDGLPRRNIALSA